MDIHWTLHNGQWVYYHQCQPLPPLHQQQPPLSDAHVLANPAARKMFTDNDSLAVLIALELQADLLILLSDVQARAF